MKDITRNGNSRKLQICRSSSSHSDICWSPPPLFLQDWSAKGTVFPRFIVKTCFRQIPSYLNDSEQENFTTKITIPNNAINCRQIESPLPSPFRSLLSVAVKTRCLQSHFHVLFLSRRRDSTETINLYPHTLRL